MRTTRLFTYSCNRRIRYGLCAIAHAARSDYYYCYDCFQIQLSFPEFKLEKPNDCDSNFVDVFSDRTDLPSRQKNFCGSVADSVTSKNNVLFIRFFAEPRAFKSSFRATYTAFREKKGGEGELLTAGLTEG